MTGSERNKMIEDNINLVYYVLWKSFPNLANDEDLQQIGMIGLIYAVDNYDMSKGSFSSYAVSIIKGYVLRAISLETKHHNAVSLETTIDGTDSLTYTDMISGEEDVNWVDLEEFRSHLTDKCNETLDYLLAGYSMSETARKLGLKRQAIGNRVTSIRKKYAELYFERGKKNES